MVGELDVNAMLRRMTFKQFFGWEVYYHLEPFGEMRADYRAASICQVLANIHRGKNQKAYKLTDFLLDFDKDVQKSGQSVQEKLNVMTVIARAWALANAENNANAAAASAVAREHGVTL